MTVTVDDQTLPAEAMGLKTVGQVLAHLQKDDRLVVHVLIDGQEPDLDHMPQVRQSPLQGHTLYVETACPRVMALDVLAAMEAQLTEADELKAEAGDLMQTGQFKPALQKLSGCFSRWQSAQEAVLKTAELLRIDLDRLDVDGQGFRTLFAEFNDHTKSIRAALDARDYVTLGDLLLYESTDASEKWLKAIDTLRATIEG